jgi:hypothetical protein
MFNFIKESGVIRKGLFAASAIATLYLISTSNNESVDTEFNDELFTRNIASKDQQLIAKKKSTTNKNSSKRKKLKKKEEKKFKRVDQTDLNTSKRVEDYFAPLQKENNFPSTSRNQAPFDDNLKQVTSQEDIEDDGQKEDIEDSEDQKKKSEDTFSALEERNTASNQDTSDFTQISETIPNDNSSGSGGSSPLTCSFDKSEGVYSTPFAVTLTCSEAVNITFCLKTGGGFCDPNALPTVYTIPIIINAGDNTYTISFFAESIESGIITLVKELSYAINTTVPAILIDFPKVNLQTTQLPFFNHTQSTDFGLSNHFYHQINFKSHDPTASGLNWTCNEMYNDYLTLSTPTAIVVQNEFDVSGLLPAAQIDQSIDLARLDPGDNYIVTIIENRDLNLFACQVQNVTIADFFTSQFIVSGSTSVIGGVRTTAGGFISMGHFQVAPNTSVSGTSENTQTGVALQNNIYDIMY